uniref:hypothetical protein n=1 Tax=Psychrobacter sp. I-STPA6b TaxID=2585718 RepID=UPI001D0BF91C
MDNYLKARCPKCHTTFVFGVDQLTSSNQTTCCAQCQYTYPIHAHLVTIPLAKKAHCEKCQQTLTQQTATNRNKKADIRKSVKHYPEYPAQMTSRAKKSAKSRAKTKNTEYTIDPSDIKKIRNRLDRNIKQLTNEKLSSTSVNLQKPLSNKATAHITKKTTKTAGHNNTTIPSTASTKILPTNTTHLINEIIQKNITTTEAETVNHIINDKVQDYVMHNDNSNTIKQNINTQQPLPTDSPEKQAQQVINTATTATPTKATPKMTAPKIDTAGSQTNEQPIGNSTEALNTDNTDNNMPITSQDENNNQKDTKSITVKRDVSINNIKVVKDTPVPIGIPSIKSNDDNNNAFEDEDWISQLLADDDETPTQEDTVTADTEETPTNPDQDEAWLNELLADDESETTSTENVDAPVSMEDEVSSVETASVEDLEQPNDSSEEPFTLELDEDNKTTQAEEIPTNPDQDEAWLNELLADNESEKTSTENVDAPVSIADEVSSVEDTAPAEDLEQPNESSEEFTLELDEDDKTTQVEETPVNPDQDEAWLNELLADDESETTSTETVDAPVSMEDEVSSEETAPAEDLEQPNESSEEFTLELDEDDKTTQAEETPVNPDQDEAWLNELLADDESETTSTENVDAPVSIADEVSSVETASIENIEETSELSEEFTLELDEDDKTTQAEEIPTNPDQDEAWLNELLAD